MLQKRKLIRFLLLPIGIISFLVISLFVPLSYTPDTSVPFPYIPPPPNGHYIETTPFDLMFFQVGSNELFAEPFLPAPSLEIYKGEAFIFKNVLITIYAVVTRKIQPYILGEGLADPETGDLSYVS